MMDRQKRIGFLSGILLIALFACTATYLAEMNWLKQLRFSPLIVGIIIGMVYANTLRKALPAEWNTGIAFSSKQILRTGIVLYGFQVTIGDVMEVGWAAVAVDAAIVVLTLCLGVMLGRALKMDRQTALLTSVGSSICGAAAVLGAEPVVKGEAHKTAVAVSTVVIFGTLAMFLYPSLYRADVFDMDARQMGIYTGATLHEVAHVYGAGEAMNGTDDTVQSACQAMTSARQTLNTLVEQHLTRFPLQSEVLSEPMASMNGACNVLKSKLCTVNDAKPDIKRPAVIVKMVRVIMLAPVLIVLALLLGRRQKSADGKPAKIQVPLFAFFFLAVIGFNSLDLLPATCVDGIRKADTFLLTMAMTALGVETSFDKFRKAGPKPFLLALLLFVWLFFGGYGLVKAVTACIG